MHQAKSAIRLASAAVLVLVGVFAIWGQNEPRMMEQSYQVSLQFVTGSNDSGKSELPASLSGIVKDLRNNFGFSTYRVAGTLIGRIGSNGNYEYKSVANISGVESLSSSPIFVEWTLQGLHGITSSKGPALEGAAFRLGARVPVLVPRETEGRSAQVYNYEQIGLTVQRLGFVANAPTLIGSLSLPNTPSTIFLILTAKAID